MKTIIFDFDGTLVDSFTLFKNSLAAAVIKFKVTVDKDLIAQDVRELGIPSLIKKLNFSFLKTLLIFKWMRDYQLKYSSELLLIPGIFELLKTLKADGFKLYVLSANRMRNIKFILERDNCWDLFENVYVDRLLWRKDLALKRLIKKERLEILESVYVGDEITDIHACNKIGLRIVGVSWGFNSVKLLSTNNTVVLSSIEELQKELYS